MKYNELTVLLRRSLDTDTTSYNQVIDSIKNLIETYGGQIDFIENEGIKRLAYPIGDDEYALYNNIFFKTEDDSKYGEMANNINRMKEVSRYLLTYVEEDEYEEDINRAKEKSQNA